MANQSIEQEALERMARMYSAAHHTPPRRHGPSADEVQPPPQDPPPREPSPSPTGESPPAAPGLLHKLLKNNEQGLLLVMMALLLGENTSPELLLAILYLLL